MKTKKPNSELEQEDIEEGSEVEAGGPSIASAKKSKITIIAASSLLITVVIYFLFVKPESKPEEKLVEVAPPPKASAAAPSENGKSPFELETNKEKAKDDLDLLGKPASPDVPALPKLPEGTALQEELNLSPQTKLVDKDGKPMDPLAIALPTPTPPTNQAANSNQQAPNGQNPNGQPNPNEPVKKDINPRYSPIIVAGGGGDGGTAIPSIGVGYDKNIVKLNEDPIDKLQKTKSTIATTYIADRSHTIAQGKLLTAVLETAINTEIPGFVRGIISRDVYGESGSEVLIPKGSRLFGSYSTQVNRGQGRVAISWTRLIRSDGVDLAIAFNASDQFGRSGIPGDVDSKYGSIITTSLLTSILAVGGVSAAQKLLTNNSATTTTTNPQQGTTTTTGSAANQAIYDVSKTIIDTVGQVIGNAIDVKPVITVPQGTRVTVIVNSDINIPSLSKR